MSIVQSSFVPRCLLYLNPLILHTFNLPKIAAFWIPWEMEMILLLWGKIFSKFLSRIFGISPIAPTATSTMLKVEAIVKVSACACLYVTALARQVTDSEETSCDDSRLRHFEQAKTLPGRSWIQYSYLLINLFRRVIASNSLKKETYN